MSESLRVESDVLPNVRWGIVRRLEFMEFRLYWEGRINRSDLTSYFGISVPQASADLARYQQIAPGNVVYDKRAKTYFAAESFEPVLFRPSADRYLAQARATAEGLIPQDESWTRDAPAIGAVPMPRRAIPPDVLRAVLTTIRRKHSIEIKYQSLNRPKPTWRWITPHALAFDGIRWHVRAFCHIDHIYKDFLFPRMLEVRGTKPPEIAIVPDRAWLETVRVRLGPDPRLEPPQRKVIELDYGMKHGECVLEVRRASLFYFLRRLGLDPRAPAKPARDQQIIVINADEVAAALRGS